ncbi:MAG: ArsR/SmtB family transcription factor [Janthinobacterium lividum]
MSERGRVETEVVDEHGLAMRRLQRPEQLRALAHPRRLQILDLLIAEGALTASQCAVELGDSAASCSYHLRQLARFGFVEEAEGGHGRNRPWRRVPLGNRIDTGDTPAERSAAEALAAVLDEHNLERIRRFHERRAGDPWRDSASSSDWSIRITEDELLELGAAVAALLAPLQRRTFAGDVPAGSRIVDVLTYLMPRRDERPAQSRVKTTNGGDQLDA